MTAEQAGSEVNFTTHMSRRASTGKADRIFIIGIEQILHCQEQAVFVGAAHPPAGGQVDTGIQGQIVISGWNRGIHPLPHVGPVQPNVDCRGRPPVKAGTGASGRPVS